MSTRGRDETALLQQNVEEQMQRLIAQLEDLEANKADLDKDEYETLYNETLDQLKDFKASLEKMMAGNITLVDSLSSIQLV